MSGAPRGSASAPTAAGAPAGLVGGRQRRRKSSKRGARIVRGRPRRPSRSPARRRASFGEHVALVQHGDLLRRIRRVGRGRTSCRARRRRAVLPSSERKSSAVRSVSSCVMPATGSSSSSRRGFWISSMPISSHCFWPCESSAGASLRVVLQVDENELVDRSGRAARREAEEQRCANAAVGRRARARGSRTPGAGTRWASGTCGRRRGSAISYSRSAQQVDRRAEGRLAVVGARLAGDDVHHRRLAGAVGPDDAAQLAGADRERQGG